MLDVAVTLGETIMLNRQQAFRTHLAPSRAESASHKVSDPIWSEQHELLLTWLPNTEPFVLAGATHLMQIQNPRGMAEGLAVFFARQPLSASFNPSN
jgi:hypothetical protein